MDVSEGVLNIEYLLLFFCRKNQIKTNIQKSKFKIRQNQINEEVKKIWAKTLLIFRLQLDSYKISKFPTRITNHIKTQTTENST